MSSVILQNKVAMSSVAAQAGLRTVTPRLATVLKRGGGGGWCGGGGGFCSVLNAVASRSGPAPVVVAAAAAAAAPAPSAFSRHHRRPFRSTVPPSAAVRPAAAAAAGAGAGGEDGAGAGAHATASTTTRKQRLVFLGTPDVAASALEAILDAAAAPDAEFEVHAVVSQPGRPRGRGRSKSGPPPPSPVAETAIARGVPEERVLCPVKANEDAFLDALREMQPDLMVTAAYGNFLPQKFLDIPRLGTLNIHPSLLPQYRGAAPVQRALEHGAAATGVSVAYTVLAMVGGKVNAVGGLVTGGGLIVYRGQGAS